MRVSMLYFSLYLNNHFLYSALYHLDSPKIQTNIKNTRLENPGESQLKSSRSWRIASANPPYSVLFVPLFNKEGLGEI